MSAARLAWHQLRYDQKVFWRDPTAVFFTVALPLMFLFIFVTIFGNEAYRIGGGRRVNGSTYYVPAIVTLGIIAAAFVFLAVSVTVSRERGLLKRLRKTPLPPIAFMAGRVGTAIVVALLLVVALVALGRVVYGVDVPGGTLPGALLALVVGTASFCALALALTAAIPSENSAVAITNAIVLPLQFISGIFIPTELIPDGMLRVADVFPVKHLYDAMLTAFDPGAAAPGIEWLDLAVVGAWGLAGIAVAVRTFRWVPRGR